MKTIADTSSRQALPSAQPATDLSGVLRSASFSDVPRRRWTARQPAVLGASLLLTVYLWAAGIQPEDLIFIPILGLVCMFVTMLFDRG